MPVTQVLKDKDAHTLTVHAEFPAPVARVWRLWADPRQLERWWGPPSYPAKVEEHDLRPGGRVTYTMTGPQGDKHGGYWKVLAVDPPRSLEVEDGFAGEDAQPNPDLPTMRMRMTLEEIEGGTRMTVVSTFASLEAMQTILDMGAEEGMRAAMGQIDDILAEAA